MIRGNLNELRPSATILIPIAWRLWHLAVALRPPFVNTTFILRKNGRANSPNWQYMARHWKLLPSAWVEISPSSSLLALWLDIARHLCSHWKNIHPAGKQTLPNPSSLLTAQLLRMLEFSLKIPHPCRAPPPFKLSLPPCTKPQLAPHWTLFRQQSASSFRCSNRLTFPASGFL